MNVRRYTLFGYELTERDLPDNTVLVESRAGGLRYQVCHTAQQTQRERRCCYLSHLVSLCRLDGNPAWHGQGTLIVSDTDIVAVASQAAPMLAVNRAHYPHDCPRCRAPAYVGGGPSDIDCSSGCFRRTP